MNSAGGGLEGGEPPKLPGRCSSMEAPASGYPDGNVADWLLLDQKCMNPVDYLVVCTCERGHMTVDVVCTRHSKGNGDGQCGICATAGHQVPMRVQPVYRLR